MSLFLSLLFRSRFYNVWYMFGRSTRIRQIYVISSLEQANICLLCELSNSIRTRIGRNQKLVCSSSPASVIYSHIRIYVCLLHHQQSPQSICLYTYTNTLLYLYIHIFLIFFSIRMYISKIYIYTI